MGRDQLCRGGFAAGSGRAIYPLDGTRSGRTCRVKQPELMTEWRGETMINRNTQRIAALAVLTSFAFAASAQAAVYSWQWTPASTDGTGVGVSHKAGRINSVDASFDSNTNRLTWMVNFGDVPNYSWLETEGFTLAINGGPNPKGHAGEMALLYFDASGGTPVLSAYAYNGLNNYLSYDDGSPRNGRQNPDRIVSSLLGNSWINDLVVRNEADGTRTLGFDIDASIINNHTPNEPGPGGVGEWSGVAFGDTIGVWMHPFAGLDTRYGSFSRYLREWDPKKEGWLDGTDFNTVPEPGSIILLALGGASLIARRRKATA